MSVPFILSGLIALTTSLAPVYASAAKKAEAPKKAETVSIDIMSIAQDKALALATRLEQQEGIPANQTLGILQDAKYLPKVADAVKPPKHWSQRNWDVYRSRFVEPTRIRKGLQFWEDNAATLAEAEKKYGVPRQVIVAIIGVETMYGENTGGFRLIDALSTLGFAYPQGAKDRSAFFQQELEAFFVLCKKNKLNPLEVKGSYAGAIGLGQFMPSSWLNFAVDGDQDGVIDLFHSTKDAIHSVGNFLKVHGWQTGKAGRVLVEITNAEHLNTLLEPDIVPTFTPQTLREKGVVLKTETQPDELLALIELVRGKDTPPAFIAGGQNFFTVTRYNKSSFYANAVLELAEALKFAKQLPVTPTPQAGNTPVDK